MKRNRKMKKIISSILATIIILTLSISLVACGTNNVEGLTKAAIKAYLKPDLKSVSAYLLVSDKDRFEYYAEEYGMTVEEYLKENYDCSSLDEYYKEQGEEFADDLYDVYGKFEYEIRDVKDDEYTTKELKKLQEDIDESVLSKRFDIDSTKIDAATECKVKVRINGEEGSDTVGVKLVLVKYDGKWKIYDYDY